MGKPAAAVHVPDGTVIGRVKGSGGNAALRKYFEENVLGTEGYVNYLDSELLEPYYEDGTLDPNSAESYEKQPRSEVAVRHLWGRPGWKRRGLADDEGRRHAST